MFFLLVLLFLATQFDSEAFGQLMTYCLPGDWLGKAVVGNSESLLDLKDLSSFEKLRLFALHFSSLFFNKVFLLSAFFVFVVQQNQAAESAQGVAA